MARLYYLSSPFVQADVTLALESGVDGIIVPRENVEHVRSLARGEVLSLDEVSFVTLTGKQDEEDALEKMRSGKIVILQHGWEVIPVENLLAQTERVFVAAESVLRARLAAGILERGVFGIVLGADVRNDLKTIVAQCKIAQEPQELVSATITAIRNVGLGHRVCVDTLSLFHRGQGMLVGNSNGFLFLVHAETEENAYVAARPFRINAGGVHAYAKLPKDRTCYLGELAAGREILVCDFEGRTEVATVGRVKIEVRPMLMVEAEVVVEGETKKGSVFLQNAETIRLTSPEGEAQSVVRLKEGDRVLCRLDTTGRHFGMRISEEIQEL